MKLRWKPPYAIISIDVHRGNQPCYIEKNMMKSSLHCTMTPNKAKGSVHQTIFGKRTFFGWQATKQASSKPYIGQICNNKPKLIKPRCLNFYQFVGSPMVNITLYLGSSA